MMRTNRHNISKQISNCIALLLFTIFSPHVGIAQVERVQIVHPVYNYLLHAETAGALQKFSYAVLPLRREQIIQALQEIRSNDTLLNEADINTLLLFEREFKIQPRENRVVVKSASDTSSIFWEGFVSDAEKLLYHNADSTSSVSISPLASVEQWGDNAGGKLRQATAGQAGIRLFGTIDNSVGYFLQITNGAVLRGEKEVLLSDPLLRRNIKFAVLNSDFDFSESHVVYRKDWFWASVGRERTTIGSGFYNRAFLNDIAPPADALQLGVEFENFSYRYIHASLLGSIVSRNIAGIGTLIPSKFYVFHRAAVHGNWGEIGISESIIYSERNYDLAYLLPISFLKNLEHSLRDRDNAGMGLDLALRPWQGGQIKGSFFLDDLIFSEIGKGYWGNKTAWNIGIGQRLAGLSADVIAEYSRVEPYTYTHFNPQNRMVNDDIQFANILPPNSDELAIGMQWWFGGRYPLSLRVAHRRHGRNIMAGDSVLRNVGGDIDETREFDRNDSYYVTFLDGDREDIFSVAIESGIEIIRGLNIKALYRFENISGQPLHSARILLRFEDF